MSPHKIEIYQAHNDSLYRPFRAGLLLAPKPRALPWARLRGPFRPDAFALLNWIHRCG